MIIRYSGEGAKEDIKHYFKENFWGLFLAGPLFFTFVIMLLTSPLYGFFLWMDPDMSLWESFWKWGRLCLVVGVWFTVKRYIIEDVETIQKRYKEGNW